MLILWHFAFNSFFLFKSWSLNLTPSCFRPIETCFRGKHFTQLLFYSQPSIRLCPCGRYNRAFPRCQELGTRALGVAVRTPVISAISAAFQEQVVSGNTPTSRTGDAPQIRPGHAWCCFPKRQPWSASVVPAGFVIVSSVFWHWRSQGDKGSDAASTGHRHHLSPVLIHSPLKTRKLLWSQKKERKKSDMSSGFPTVSW